VQEGKTIVKVCNASTEELIISKGTVLAVATVVPVTAFRWKGDREEEPTANAEEIAPEGTIDSVIGAAFSETSPSREPMPGLKEAYLAELEADFTDSKLSEKQQSLIHSLLGEYRDSFVESSLQPGRTDLLKFHIDTGDHPPIKQQPYRVSNAEGDVM
jgi:hypothetical protein